MNPLNSFPADSPWHRTLMEHKPHLDNLMAREQLMEDIDSIIESNFAHVDYKDDVTKQLCDAVCKHFPTPTPE